MLGYVSEELYSLIAVKISRDVHYYGCLEEILKSLQSTQSYFRRNFNLLFKEVHQRTLDNFSQLPVHYGVHRQRQLMSISENVREHFISHQSLSVRVCI
jgi:hypothetical protein